MPSCLSRWRSRAAMTQVRDADRDGPGHRPALAVLGGGVADVGKRPRARDHCPRDDGDGMHEVPIQAHGAPPIWLITPPLMPTSHSDKLPAVTTVPPRITRSQSGPASALLTFDAIAAQQ